MNERLTALPFEAARKAGQAILWLTDTFIPPDPTVETKAASITIISTPEYPDKEAA